MRALIGSTAAQDDIAVLVLSRPPAPRPHKRGRSFRSPAGRSTGRSL
jgi:hypothetical protein